MSVVVLLYLYDLQRIPGLGRSCPHIVFTLGRTHNISNSRLAPKRAVLPTKRQRENN